MAVPPEFLRELRARIPVSEVARRHVRLQRQGREYVGLSPFNKERTPSFTVNDEKQFFHCFSSGEHGDIFTLLAKLENLSFMEAVEKLAEEAGLEVPKPSPEAAQRYQQRLSLYDAVEAACQWFQARLHDPGTGAAALAYLRDRGLDDATIRYFRLGYAPRDGQALKEHLVAQGFSEAQLHEAGLVRTGRDGRRSYSFFRDRVLFPVSDRRGRVVAFGGRRMGEDGPKYLNTGDTALFSKGQLLYGLALARAATGDAQPVVVVEGYTDVIALHRAGYRAAVAPLGTAITEAQIAELWRLSRSPHLCFDGDAAGRRAAGRAVERILPQLRPDHTVHFAFLPPGEDPDTLVQRGGPQAVGEVLAGAVPLPKAVWYLATAGRQLDDPDGRAGAEAALESYVAQIANRTVQHNYRQVFRQWLRARSTPPARKPNAPQSREERRRQADPPERRRPGNPMALRAQVLIATVLVHPSLFAEVGEELAMLDTGGDATAQTVLSALVAALSTEGDLDSTALARQLDKRGAGAAARSLYAAARAAGGPALRPDGLAAARRLWRYAPQLAERAREVAEACRRVDALAEADGESEVLAEIRRVWQRGPVDDDPAAESMG